ncbi:MAG TPA: FMN-binding protein [Candidatus Paceibacterota bacterium]|jgi:uncharacterized protein with FMN-binding domain|nr:FMN-binding protein [Candidatus Paceibacterota bacterium]
MKKFILSATLVVLFGGYVFFLKSGQSGQTLLPSEANTPTQNPAVADGAGTNASDQTLNKPQATPVSEPPKTTPKTTTPAPKPVTKSGWKDGTFTGASVDAYFGNVQVSATISGGKLTNIAFLEYPSDNRTSLGKSQMSLPRLKQEAITAQSANVNIISGATQTSEGFMQSLSSALSKAKA